MEKVDFIFVTLVYRAYTDLYDFCESLKNVKGSYRVIVVESYYDEKTSANVKNTAEQLNCFYVPVENKGYGYGNNKGIDFANTHFDYSWLIVCNPDTVLMSEINKEKLVKYKEIVAPKIVAKNEKNQNPYWAAENTIGEWLIYKGFCNNSQILLYLGVGFNKIIRDAFKFINTITKGKINSIYACHGSFLILRKEFVETFRYDENMFLFYEEAYLAREAKKRHAVTNYANDILVSHKEDASMNLAKIDEHPILKESYTHYYESYRM